MDIRVRVGNWSNSRSVYSKGGKLFFQVAAGCIDCSICKSRINEVSMALHRKAIQHDVVANNERTVVHVGLPMPPKGTRVEKYLSDILGVPVSKA